MAEVPLSFSQRIRQISKELLQVQQGSLYLALHRLEKRYWLEAEWGESDNARQAKFPFPDSHQLVVLHQFDLKQKPAETS